MLNKYSQVRINVLAPVSFFLRRLKYQSSPAVRITQRDIRYRLEKSDLLA